jgi:lipoprotein-anchoring transpeptidase ErfK/SrfK
VDWIRGHRGHAARCFRATLVCLTFLAATGCNSKPEAAKPEPPAASAPAPQPIAPVVAKRTRLAVLLTAHQAYSEPSRDSAPVGHRVQAKRPLTGERTALPVLGSTPGSAAAAWLQVALPGRPNGHTGWITQRGTVAATAPWHIRVDLSARSVTIFHDGRPVRSAKAVVGKPSTPTPLGEFFVEESIALPPAEVGAPFALALSARSDVFQRFAGGPGQIALHGLMNVGGVLGTATSHGCVRLDNSMMRWLVKRIRPGTTVTITP